MRREMSSDSEDIACEYSRLSALRPACCVRTQQAGRSAERRLYSQATEDSYISELSDSDHEERKVEEEESSV